MCDQMMSMSSVLWDHVDVCVVWVDVDESRVQNVLIVVRVVLWVWLHVWGDRVARRVRVATYTRQ